MAKPNIKEWPELAAFIDGEGMSYKFADFIDMKYRSDACYVVLVWDREDGYYGLCDLAAPTPKGPWEFQNDSEECSPKQWKKLRIVPDCDWYTMPEED